MQTQRTAVSVAAGTGIICTFLPWVNAPFLGALDGTSMEDGLGWITFTLCLVALCCAIGGPRHLPFTPLTKGVCALLGIAVVAIGISVVSRVTEVTGGELQIGRYGVGVGLYLLIAAGAGITLSPIVAGRSRNQPSPNWPR
jgi:hypothetical protein